MRMKIVNILLYPFILLDELLGMDSSTQYEAVKRNK